MHGCPSFRDTMDPSEAPSASFPTEHPAFGEEPDVDEPEVR